jgi:hypothetical protein
MSIGGGGVRPAEALATIPVGMTFFPFGTFLRLVHHACRGSRKAMVSLVWFVVGLGLVIGSSIAGSGVGIIIGGVMFAVGVLGSRPPVW